MDEIPQYLIEFMDVNQYKLENILQYNQRKYVFVLKVIKNNQKFILKAFDKKRTPMVIQNKLRVEHTFYQKNMNIEVIPNLVDLKDNIMILEYIESISIRENLLNKKNINIVENLLYSVDVFQKALVNHESTQKESFENVHKYINSLANSHPIQAKNIYIDRVDIVLNKIITKILKRKLNTVLVKFNSVNLTKNFSHMDFHYNNILIDKKLKIKFIDFENIEYKGYFEFDILFLIVLIEVYIYKGSCEYKFLECYKSEFFKRNRILEEIYNLYTIAISVNKKFYIGSEKKSLNKLEKIQLGFSLIK